MSITLNEVIKILPKDRQKVIKLKADKMISEYKTLQALRKDLGFTQTDIAFKQGVKQVNISNLEKRHDMHLSTLKNMWKHWAVSWKSISECLMIRW